jgi:hypothetical protein
MKSRPNLLLVKNEVEIIDALVDNNLMFPDFSKSQVTWFFYENNFNIVLFLVEDSGVKHFEMFTVKDFANSMNEMITLWNIFDHQILHDQHTLVMRFARNKVHDLIAMAETFQAMSK